MAEAPGFLAKFEGIVDPGGDPDAIRHAAAACRRLAEELDDRLDALGPVATGLANHWQGSASDGFQRTWKKFVPGLTEYAGQLGAAAAALDRIADVIRQAQVKASHLKIAMAATVAVGVALTIVSFGTSAAVGAAALEAEAGAFAVWIAETLGAEIATLEALLTAIETTATRFALGSGVSTVAVGAVKGLHGQNPLDPASWSADDLTHVLFDGVLTAGVGVLADTTAIGAAFEAHPYASAAAAGALRSASASALGQFWLNGKPITDLQTWETVGVSGTVAAVSGPGVARVLGGSAGDLTRGLTGIPSGTVNYALNFPQAVDALGLQEPRPLTDLPVVPPPTPIRPLEPPTPIPSRPASYTVRRGDSLWSIAARRLGDPYLWPRLAEANRIAPPYVIRPNQVLKIPSAG